MIIRQADLNLPKIIEYVSTIPINVDGSNVFELDDPEIFRHPIIYVSEPGTWRITDTEATNLRQYLLKGGFLILDDFEADQWYNMEAQLLRAMPDHQLIEIGPDHPVFSSFFELEDIYVPHPLVTRHAPLFRHVREQRPEGAHACAGELQLGPGRILGVGGRPEFRADTLSNEAFKLGVNYILYGLDASESCGIAGIVNRES